MSTENGLDTSFFIDPLYTSGEFFRLSKGSRDAVFKVKQLHDLLVPYLEKHPDIILEEVIDLGCGSGDTTWLLSDMFRSIGRPVFVKGYDIHPAMKHLSGGKNVSFHYADFTHTEPSDKADLVIMFDVIEHVPGPLGFLRAVSERARFVALHIPLDDSWLLGMRNLWKRNLLHPGRLLVLNVSSAINLLTFSGLRVEDYSLTPVFRAPFGTETRSQRLLNPIRRVLYRISPYVLQRTLGGVSLMVLATNAYAFHRP